MDATTKVGTELPEAMMIAQGVRFFLARSLGYDLFRSTTA